jgi:cell division septal protein FtsQ
LREQVITQKVGNRSGISGKGRSGGVDQRPARREREAKETAGVRLKALLAYVPIALKVVLIVIIGVLVFLGYRAAASASFFQIRNVETRGAIRASDQAIQATVRHDVSETGVWRADLQALSAHLQRLPWVRTAVVTRVLPDGVRVRITERQPSAVVRTSAGRFIWVDEDAVFLGEMLPADPVPGFFLRGWDEGDSATARDDNRDRIKTFLELQRDWDAQGLSERVSEVNVLDIRDVRAQLAGDDSQIEVRLGGQDLGQRLKRALEVLDTQRQTVRGPLISYIDLTQGRRAVVGLVSGGRTIGEGIVAGGEPEQSLDSRPTPVRSRTDKPLAEKIVKEPKPRQQAKKTDQKRT